MNLLLIETACFIMGFGLGFLWVGWSGPRTLTSSTVLLRYKAKRLCDIRLVRSLHLTLGMSLAILFSIDNAPSKAPNKDLAK